MKSQTIGIALCVLMLLVGVLEVAIYYSRLPDTVASHFGPDNSANGWMPKGAFFAIFGVVVAVLAFSMLGSALLSRRLPARWINLPNKDYWLAPERRGETWSALTDYMVWACVAALALLAAIMHLSVRANLDGRQKLSDKTYLFVVGYFLFMAAWTVGMFRRFRKPKPPGESFPAPAS